MSEDKKSLVNMENLTGFSKPLEKLFEITGKGIGSMGTLLFSKKLQIQ